MTMTGGMALTRPMDGTSLQTTGKGQYMGAGVGKGVERLWWFSSLLLVVVFCEIEAISSAEGKPGQEGLEVED